MRCCGRIDSLCLSIVILFAVLTAQAANIAAQGAQLAANDDGGYSLSANFVINLNPRLEEAVNKGVSLHFSADFELTRSRWYWFDEQIIRRSKTFELSYHALTRQYRLSTGGLHQNFASLDEALRMLSRLRYWQVVEKGETQNDRTYLASLRMRLDLAQMPRTFQVSALSSRDWNLSSDWLRWDFSTTEAASPPVIAPSAPAAAPIPTTESK